jgi:HD superfamily phosphodiesterase
MCGGVASAAMHSGRGPSQALCLIACAERFPGTSDAQSSAAHLARVSEEADRSIAFGAEQAHLCAEPVGTLRIEM